jgi:hypothetical protein
MARQDAYKELSEKVIALRAELPCISFGYLGNYERWGDDTHWYIFLPHYSRVGTYSDSYGLGPGKQADIFEIALANWDSKIVPALRKMYAADKNRIGLGKLNAIGNLVDANSGTLIGLGISPAPKFESPEAAAEYLKHYNTPVVVVKG